MKTQLQIVFCILSMQLNIFSQLSGNIQDSNTKQGLAFVNIGLIGKSIGTVSDESGNFLLQCNSGNENDSIKISIIGYKNIVMTLKEFEGSYGKNNAIVSMQQANFKLNEVVIKPSKTITKVIGNKNKSKAIIMDFGSAELGSELGIPFKIKNRTTYIEELNFNIAQNKYKDLVFRINIYTLKNGLPDQNILTEPLYASFPSTSGTLTVDLRNKNISVEDDFFISLEWLKDYGKGGLQFAAGFVNKHAYARSTSQDQWHKIPAGPGFNCVISYQK